MGGDDSQKLFAPERKILLSGAQTSGSRQTPHSTANAETPHPSPPRLPYSWEK